jgi:hypothetical protein
LEKKSHARESIRGFSCFIMLGFVTEYVFVMIANGKSDLHRLQESLPRIPDICRRMKRGLPFESIIFPPIFPPRQASRKDKRSRLP